MILHSECATLLAALAAVLALSCSASSEGDGASGGDGTGANGAGGGVFGGGGNGFGAVGGDGFGGDGFGGSANASGVDNFPGCNEETYTGERLPMDMYIMYDQSLSMTCPVPTGGDRWTAVRTAMDSFFRSSSAAGLGVGIGYFGNVPISSGQPVSCDPAVYEVPDVEIGALPGNAQALVDSLSRHGPSTTTPTPPALAGALNHTIAWRDSTGRPAVVLLVTDGQPNDCGAPGLLGPMMATPQDVAFIADAGLTGANMRTYVIGIVGDAAASCEWDPNPPNVADLDLVANAGGTERAFIVDATQNVSDQFLQKLNEVRTSAQLPCDFLLPTASSEVDVNKVNLTYAPPGSPDGQRVYYAQDPSVCDPAQGGWYYDNPAAPTRIILCPATCDTVSAQQGGRVSVVLGCPTEPIQ